VELSKYSDIELIDLARKNNHSAFKVLVERYESQVSKAVIGMLGECDEAEDVGQETFIRFYRALDKFRGDSGVGTYLTKIAINLSLNEIKRQKRQRKLIRIDNDDKNLDIPASSTGEEGDSKEIVEKALLSLEPKQRSIVIVRMLEGYSTKETAQIFGIPQGTVLSRLSRAQQKLKTVLEKYLTQEK